MEHLQSEEPISSDPYFRSSNLEHKNYQPCGAIFFIIEVIKAKKTTFLRPWKWKKMKPYEFIITINLRKVEKLWKFGGFQPVVFVWLSKKFLAFFQFSWPWDVLNIQNHSNLCYIEAIFAENLAKWISE